VISAAQAGAAVKNLYIPTPETNVSTVDYDQYYVPRFQQPQTYIRFSSTVEDTSGCPYCMTGEDEVYLKKLNSKSKKAGQCSEDQFEIVMNVFEEISALKQPFASVDNAPVLSLEEMVAAFDDEVDIHTRVFAKDIYPHWKDRRLLEQNHPLMPALKFERNVDTDDSDPYVCFRRREVRQARKTRGRDAQIVEKLKKLRTELETGRQLMHLVKQREIGRREQLAMERSIFDKRLALKMSKRQLGIKGEDEDLINQKPIPKPRPRLDPAIINRGGVGAGVIPKLPLPSTRADGRFPESDLVQLHEEKVRKQSDIDHMIQDSMTKHRTWNNDWVDQTWRPITPPLENAAHGGRNPFRDAVTKFLPTPPESVSEGEDVNTMVDGGRTPMTQYGEKEIKTKLPIRFESPPIDALSTHGMTLRRPSYRRRQGRGGRLFIDRRGLKRPSVEEEEHFTRSKRQRLEEEGYSHPLMSPPLSAAEDRERDRAAYDLDSDEDTDIYRTDPYDDWNIRYRIAFGYTSSSSSSSRPANQEQQVATQAKMIQEEQRRVQQAAVSNSSSSRVMMPTS
jgi:enhancer of polycomb-like protein